MGSDHLTESWRAIPGWEAYEVSDFGRVRSVDRTVEYPNGSMRRFPGRELHQFLMSRGHLYVHLHNQVKGSQTKTVHRLVLAAFIGPAPEGTECCHYDGDPANNRIKNLRWASRSENMNDRFRHGWTVTAPSLARIARNGANKCARGHEMTPENMRSKRIPGQFPRCRKCHAEDQRAYRSRLRLAKQASETSAERRLSA